MAHRGHIGTTFFRAGVLALLLGFTCIGSAQTDIKNGNTFDNLNNSGAWNSGTPTSASIALWTNTSAGGSFNLGANLTWGEVKIVNPSGAVTFNSGDTVTLDSVAGVGIDMSTASQSLTINSGVALGAAQTWLTGTGAGLTIGGNVNNAGFMLTIGGAGNATISSVVSGSGGLTMNSTGTLTLSGANTYSGGTTVDKGIVNANTLFETGDSSSSLGTGSLTLNGGTLRYDGASFTTANFATTIGANGGTLDIMASPNLGPIFYGGTVSGSGTLTILDSSGNGEQWLFTGTNSSFTGNINIGNGSAGSGWLQVRANTAANQVGTGTVTVNGGGTFSYDQGLPATIANPIVLNGGALGAQSVAITYSGPIVISNNSFIGGVQLTVGTTETLSGVISGPGGFTTAGNNGTTTIVLGNANTFSGGATLSSGTLTLNNSLALQNSTLTDQTNNHLVFGAPTSYVVGGLAGSGNIGLTNSAGGIALNVGTNNATTTYSGVMSGSGSLTKMGTGAMTLTGASTYTGSTIVNNGTLKDGTVNALPTGTSLTVSGTGTFDLNGNAQTVAGLSDGGVNTGVITDSGAASTLTVNNTGSSGFAGVIGGALALTKNSAGTLTLGGPTANTYSGLTTVSAGELDLDKTAGINAIGGSLTISGGTVKLINSNQINNNAALTINSGTFDLNDNSEAVDALTGTGGQILDNGNNTGTLTIGSNNGGGTYSGTITDGNGTFALIKNGTGTETLSGNNSYSGGTTINNGTIVASSSTALGIGSLDMAGGVLQLGASVSVGDLSGNSGTIGIFVNNTTETLTVGSDNSNTTFGGVFNQGGNANTHLSLTKTGTGILTLTNLGTFNGATTINGGAINVQNALSLGTSTITVNTGGELQLQGGINAAQTLTLNSTGMSNDGALHNISGNNTYSGGITLGSASRINSDSGTLTISSFTSGGGFGLTVGGAGTIVFSAALPSTVNTLTKDGAGTVILENTGDAYVGGTIISAGTLKLGASNVLPNGAGDMTDNGTLDMAGFTDTINGLNGGGVVDNSGGGTPSLTIGGNGDGGTFTGVIQNTTGSLSITKTGAGVQVLGGTAANTYTGLTTVNGGELDLNKTAGVNAIGGSLTIAGGEVKLLSSEQLSGSAVVTVNTGSFNLNGHSETPGIMIIGAGGQLTNGVAGGALNSGITNAGQVYVSQATYLNGMVTNTGAMFFLGAISNSLVNSGSFNLNNNATLTVAPANKGTINVAASTLTVTPDWANTGTVQLGGGVLTGGNLTNNGGASVVGFGTVSNQLVNAGIVTATNGNLNLVGAANGSGVYRAVAGGVGGTLTFVNGGSVGSLFNTNSTIQVQGALTNTSTFVNEGALMAAGGTYQSAANLTNAIGAMIANSGAGTISAAGVFNLGTILATNATFTISNLVAQGGTVTIGAGGTLTVPGASSLTNFGTINLQGNAVANAVLNLGGASLTNQSNGTITGGGIIQNASQVVNLSGGSILATSTVVALQFTNANTFGNVGTIGATAGATLMFGTTGSSAIITNYGTINLSRGTLLSGNITNLAAGFFGGTGVVTAVVVNQGRMNFSGTISNGLQNSGSFTLNDDTTITSNIVVNSGGMLDLVGNNLTNGVVLTISSGGVLTNGGAANAGATVMGGVTNGGTVYVTANTYFNGTVTNTGAFVFQGVISNNLVNSGNGTVTLNNTATITQTANINGGTLNLNGQTMANGLLLVSGTGVVTNGGAGATINGAVSNANIIAVTANTFFNGAVINTGVMSFEGAISNSLVNSGSFNLNNGATLTVAPANSGTINVAASTLTVNPSWANSGTILIAGGTVAGGNLTNASGAVMTGAGNISSLLVNNGLVGVTNGTLTISVAPQQNGLVNVAGGAPGTLSVTPAWNNKGTVSVASGGAISGGNFTNAAGGTVTNLGAINTLLVNQGDVVLGGSASNFQQTSGTNIVSGSGTITGTATVTGGLFDLNGGTYSNGLMVLSGSGALTSSQANATFNGGLSNAATASFSQNVYFNGAITNTGAFLWQGAISNNFVNAGNGAVTLNNTATITKTVTFSGGTFNLNGQTYSNGLMILGGPAVLTNSIAGATFNGGLSNDATVAVTANTFFNGPITNTGTFFLQGAVSNSFINTETATLTINNNSTITGLLANLAGNQVNIGNSTLQLFSAPTQDGTIAIGANGALNVPTTWANSGTIVMSGGIINSQTLTENSGAGLTGFGTVSNGVINSAGALITASGGTLALLGSLSQNGGVLVNGSSILDVAQDWSSSGTINIAAGGAITGGNLTNTSASGTLSGSGFIDAFLVNQGRMNWGGAINNNFLQTAGSFTLSGSATITGAATVNGGTLDLVGNRLTDGQLILAGTGILTNAIVGAAVSGGISNAATVDFAADAYINGPVTNTGFWLQRGAISNSVVNSGTMLVLSNNIAARITGGVVNSGSLTFTNVFVSGTVTNSGLFSFSGAISNNLVNTANGSITLDGAGTVTGSTLINGGTFNLNGQSFTDALMVVDGSGGILTNAVAGASLGGGLSNASIVAITANTFFKGPVTNTGTFQWQGAISNTFVNSGAAKLNNAATITGTSTITAGSFDLNGKSLASSQMIVTSAGVLTNSTAGASMSGAVTLQNSTLAGQLVTNNATLSGSGTISAPLNNTAAGVILANNGLLTITGALTQNGTIEVTTGSTLDVPQAFSESGSLLMQGGFVEGGTMTVTTGDNISGFGTISNDIVNAGLITATGGTLVLAGGAPTTQAGSGINIASGGTLSISPDWANSGTLTVSGTLIGGTLTNSSNTGTLSGTGTIDTFVVNQGRMNWGGTINNSLLQTAGSLTLSGSATITGDATISGGGIDVSAQHLTVGLLTIDNGATMQNSAGDGVGTITGNVVNNGTVNFLVNDGFSDTHVVINGEVVNNGTWTGAGVINGTLVNTGSFEWTSQTYFFGFATETSPILNGGITNTGSLTFDPSYVAQVNGSVTNSGAINFNGTATGNLWQTGGTFTLNGAGTISGPANVAGGSFNLNGETYNGSTMTVSGTGALTNAVANTNFNSVLSNAANVGVTANTYFKGAVNNTGTFAFMGAVSNTFVNSGDVVLNGSGTISGTLANSGSVNVNNGTLSLVVAPTQTGTVTVNNGATLNVAQAWVNNGTISMLGGVVTNAAITNANFVSGYGTIDGGGVVNNGKIFANAGSISGNGTLTVRLTSFTNNNAATIGTANSNAVLNILQSGNILINQGTVSLSGGTIDFNGGAGTITNFNIIAGVGNVANFPIINAGTLASFVAQAPISGLSNLTAQIGVTNNGLLGANNLINGAATLSLTVSGGGSAIVNQGTVALQGGFLTINGGAGVVTNNGLVYGVGTQNLSVANLTSGTILSSNGTLRLGVFGANGGVMSNLNTASTIVLTNTVLRNTGTIALNGGGLVMGGSTITNDGTIIGPGNYSSGLYNNPDGTVIAQNGTLAIATNGATESVNNLGTFSIASASTLSVGTAWVNTNGTVSIAGGAISGGAVTNVGLLTGFGTISSQLVNLGGGTLTASGAGSLTLVAAPTQDGWVNIGNGSTLNVLQVWQNNGTVNVQGGNLVGSTIVNSDLIAGFGTITPQVHNNNGGTITANGGTLTLAVAPNQLGGVVISNAATLNVLQAWQNNGMMSLFGGTAIGSTITNVSAVTGFGTITPQMQNNSGATLTAIGGTLTLVVAPGQLGTFAVANGGTLNVQQAWQDSGLLSMAGGTAIGSTITNVANVSGFGTIAPQLVNTAGATLTASGGALTLGLAPVQDGTVVATNGGTLNVLTAWQNNGTVSFLGGNIIGSTVTNAGTMTGFGMVQNAVNSNLVLVTNGTLQVTGSLTQNGVVNVATNSQLNVTPNWANAASVLLNGGFTSGGTMTNTVAALVQGFGTISNTVVNLGAMIATNGTLNLVSAPTQSGTITVANAATLDVAQAWQNSGTVNIQGGSVVGAQLTNASSIGGFGTISSALINNNGATITASGGGTLTLTAAPLQNGAVNILGTLNVASAWSNGTAGTVTLAGGVLTGGTFTVDGTVQGNGTIAANTVINNAKMVTVNGGQMNLTALTTMNGGIINGGPGVDNYGTISGNGTISATLSSPGYVRATNGLLSIQALAGNQSVGKLEASTSGTLAINGMTPWSNNGQLIMAGGTVIGGNISNNAFQVINGFGTVTPNVYNSGEIVANNPNQALTFNQTLVNFAGGIVTANVGSIIVNGTFTNAGTLTMTRSLGTFAGPVVNSGAWITDPTTNVFQNTYTVTSSGFIQSSAGDVYIFSNNASQVASFVNQSTQSNAFSTVTGKFVFDATLSLTQTMYAAGSNIGNLSVSGGLDPVLVGMAATNALFQFENNFALGTLEIDSTTEVASAEVDGGGDSGGLESAVFLNELDLNAGAQLIISNDVQIYFISSNEFSSSQVTLLGDAGLHLLTSDASLVVPEPSVILLWLSSIVTVYAARKRAVGEK